MNPHLVMLAAIRSAEPSQAVPGLSELSIHLKERIASVGDTAFQEFAYLQQMAAETWGAERTSHFAIVLRKARVAPKATKVSRWKKVGTAIERLPADWRPALRSIAERSEAGESTKGLPIWSSEYLGAVTTALCRYVDFATRHAVALVPAGSDLHQYAVWLTDPANEEHGVSFRAAGDYVSRIKAGLSIIVPSAGSPARDFVVRYWREKGKANGTPTKVGEQLVGAVTIYDLGFLLMENARNARMRGISAATTFRNGLILALGIALPQRARAISALELGATIWVEQPDRLHVRIPARMLKVPEDQKNGDPFDMVWHNPRLVSALDEYRRCFRPLFDSGACLFPSIHAPDQAISEKRIGKVTGDITERNLGIRIPIHRFRDNAGTDAAENLVGGRLATATLLGHTDIGTGDHYDHSKGINASAEFAQFIDCRRSIPTDLVL
ncbi:hypothetical protein SAMN04488004_103246 [Loktanella salsilacus]|uniref:Tyr recombinase domain-containing protein n=1 Tax=Loktanella salsilacus TaxID=195913 RepID=A0A1I4D589_9RHOB|nr:site-specific integrase [Loktanella salsilacus]SFK88758.1 hypothetical protein SAMN04488004_103246 [Loktanella salsilacus]